MKFGTGSNAERTQKYGGSKYKMTYIRPNIYINKQTSPIFNCVTPVSVSLANKQTSPIFNCVTPVSFSLATLAHQLYMTK